MILISTSPDWDAVSDAMCKTFIRCCAEGQAPVRNRFFVLDGARLDGAIVSLAFERDADGYVTRRVRPKPNRGRTMAELCIPHLVASTGTQWEAAFVDARCRLEWPDTARTIYALVLNTERPSGDQYRVMPNVLVRVHDELYIWIERLADQMVDRGREVGLGQRRPTRALDRSSLTLSSSTNGMERPRPTASPSLSSGTPPSSLASGGEADPLERLGILVKVVLLAQLARQAAKAWGQSDADLLERLLEQARLRPGWLRITFSDDYGGLMFTWHDEARIAMLLRACYFSVLADERGRGATFQPSDLALSDFIVYQDSVARLTGLPVSPRARGPMMAPVAFGEHDGLMALAVVMLTRLFRGWLDPAHYSARHDATVREHARLVEEERSTRDLAQLLSHPWRIDDMVLQLPPPHSPGRSIRDSY